MRRIFVDTYFWVAWLDPRDPGYDEARAAREQYRTIPLVTTETVLIELLNFYAESGSFWRGRALELTRGILDSDTISLIPHGDTTLQRALDLYATRMDKGYSLTDCISMLCMREEGIFEVLTGDAHFAQEGFVPLLRRV